jgi:hypothetical protein
MGSNLLKYGSLVSRVLTEFLCVDQVASCGWL